MIGVEMLEGEEMQFKICGKDVPRLLLLGIIGNFVTSPAETTGGSSEPLASVVIDVYTGKMTLVHSFNALRSYFLETLLIISILAIAKLSLVRNVSVNKEASQQDACNKDT